MSTKRSRLDKDEPPSSASVTTTSTFSSSFAPPPPLIEDSADIDWETTLERDPYDVEIWIEYADDKIRRGLTKPAVAMVFERALMKLPGSYKLWHRYLTLRREWIDYDPAVYNQPVLDLNSTFERAINYMNKMPRIWLMFCTFLAEQKSLRLARKTFDLALAALPPTQHYLIWSEYTRFAITTPELPAASAEYILRRRARFDPEEGSAALTQFFKSREMFRAAALELLALMKSMKHDNEASRQIRREFFGLIRSHPEECSELVNVSTLDAMPTTNPMQREEKVKILEMYADHLLQLGHFDHARQVFEDAIKLAVDSIKSFALLLESYLRFEEAILDEAEKSSKEDPGEVLFRVRRLQDLLRRQRSLSSSIMLNSWTGDVSERLSLILVETNKTRRDQLLFDAFPDGEPLELFNGRRSDLFIKLAEKQDVDNREKDKILARGCMLCWDLKDIVILWRLRIELALSDIDEKRALQLARECLTPPPPVTNSTTTSTTTKKLRPSCHRSYQLWTLYLDLEEHYGTLETTRAAYERCLDLKVASVLNILNYTKLLRNHFYFEDAFGVYERSLGVFPWPHARDLWCDYLKHFIGRYGGTKIERARDLYEQCIESIPESFRSLSEFAFLNYALFEEQHGLIRRAMLIYERWSDFAPDDQKLDIYLLWSRKSEESLGAPATRKVFERAMNKLPEKMIPFIAMRFADMECRLGEIERSRAILQHASLLSDSLDIRNNAIYGDFWKFWNDFEVKFGDEDTFKEMLRQKRASQAQFSVLHAAEFARQQIQQHQKSNSMEQQQENGTVTNGSSKEHVAEDSQDVSAAIVDQNEIDLDD